ncbi:hypothetical protein [Nocardia sp. NPDC020380]|uniref:hypothetical protein n=1 Tax=Nocardia sp. NPDC020380 TaxID=3364309 RepID=UPI00379B06A8
MANSDGYDELDRQSGGTEITCLAQPEHESDGDILLLQRLPRTSRIESVTAHYLLHRFITRAEGLVTKQGPLTADQVEALRPEVTAGAPTVLEALYSYLTERLANLPGLLSMESAPVVRTVKRIVHQPGAAIRGYPSSSSR